MAYSLNEFTHRTRALVLKRAIDLIENHKVEAIERDEEHAHYHVENQRGSYYRVEIRLKDGQVAFTHCECPYRGVGLCKHTAAALLDMRQQEGFSVDQLTEADFIQHDEDVADDDSSESTLRQLIREISQDASFDLVNFLSHQEQKDLMAFIMKYLEESEDIRLVVLAYLWYKNTEGSARYGHLS